jgi:hypothetical protein
MVRRFIRFLRRVLVAALGVLTVWLIVFVIFKFADHRLHWMMAVAVTYTVAAYLILPRVVLVSLRILQHKRVPRYTITGDGLPGDPVNLVLIGTQRQLQAAFATAGWVVADPLSWKSSWRMVRAFVLNSPYPTAPFSTLYLFGRGQDIGFQKCLDNSPRRRHHIRFWALSLHHAETTLGTAQFWRATSRPPYDACVAWVGAGTKDTGFSLTKLTFQITHATDSDTNAEREFIVAELRGNNVIGEVTVYRASQRLKVEHVNHYVTDGEVAAATLVVEG